VTRGGAVSADPQFLLGYGAAFICAITWAVYSVASRSFAEVPTGAVAGFCLVTALLSGLAHVGLEETVWPADTGEWAAAIGLGLLPVGAAFYVWDYGVKKGDIQVLGASAYAAPILSTAILILSGFAEASVAIGAAALLITGGAVLASKDLFRR
jgi:drug/metabolite transporter (DMT)-like permease